MYAGRVVELGGAEELFESAGHPYTRRLVGAIPRLTGGRSAGRHPRPCAVPRAAAPGLQLRAALHAAHRRVRGASAAAARGRRRATRSAASGPNRSSPRQQSRVGDPIEHAGRRCGRAAGAAPRRTWSPATARRGPALDQPEPGRRSECLALVGESGSGKTTLARSIAGLHRNWTGRSRSAASRLPRRRAPAQQRGAAADPVHLPEPVRLAQPAPHDRPDRRRSR